MTSLSPLITDVWVGGLGSPTVGTVARPSLSWEYSLAPQAWQPHGWSIERGTIGEDGSIVPHESRQQEGAISSRREWPFDPLRSREVAAVRVRAIGPDGERSTPSDWLVLEASLLRPEDWSAQLITAASSSPTTRQPVRMRKTFEVAGEASGPARIYASGRGIIHVTVNGTRASDFELEPGWTSYDSRLLFRSYDVSGLLRQGVNTLAVIVADGWYAERYPTLDPTRGFYDGPLGAIVQLHFSDAAGDHVIGTDESWLAAQDGPTVFATLYGGERHDARLEDEVLRSAAEWPGALPARALPFDTAVLRPATMPPIRVIEDVYPEAMTRAESGSIIVDFGQNLVGRLRIRARGQAGQTLTLRHAEVLEDGELATRPLRDAEATDSYTFAADETIEWEPTFTYHGFRYAQIDGCSDAVPLEVLARVMHSDLALRGHLRTGHRLVDRFIENVEWSARGNFMSIPTDCPQRDERLGWTGDAQIFAATAMFLFDAYDFFQSWLTDLAIEQNQFDGVVPAVVPNVLLGMSTPAAGWGDAVAIVPWEMYWASGDPAILRQMYPSMIQWIDAIDRSTQRQDLWVSGFQFGDWLDPSAPPERPEAAVTAPDLVASAYLYRTVRLTAQIAQTLGESAEAARLLQRAHRVREAFLAEFLSPAMRLSSHTQTAYALFIVFDIGDPEQKRVAGDHLRELVRSARYKVSTGFLGTAVVLDALTACGYQEDAVAMLLEEGGPSWLHPVTLGATTVWERWDSLRDDGSVNPGGMTSFNHYAFGAIVDWIRKNIGGIRGLTPGYQRVAIAGPVPSVFGDVSCRLPSAYGMYSVRRLKRDSGWRVEVTVPPGGTAVLNVDGQEQEFGPGEHAFAVLDDPVGTTTVIAIPTPRADGFSGPDLDQEAGVRRQQAGTKLSPPTAQGPVSTSVS